MCTPSNERVRVNYVRVLRPKRGDELAEGEGGREELVGQHGAGERAGVVCAQPAEDLATLVGVAVGRGHLVRGGLRAEG
jgi:hypothetical protein